MYKKLWFYIIKVWTMYNLEIVFCSIYLACMCNFMYLTRPRSLCAYSACRRYMHPFPPALTRQQGAALLSVVFTFRRIFTYIKPLVHVCSYQSSWSLRPRCSLRTLEDSFLETKASRSQAKALIFTQKLRCYMHLLFNVCMLQGKFPITGLLFI